ncbi:MAG: SUMF1/EgtB/PvdO family nonheme iron enzyme, partial [Opitutales bacterium]|nr:SUMF1/EgtB/PvdO family nonheme iron enzyme [Opitutales bacterium]
YVLERLLGAGAMGEVYLARQVILDQRCAIKVLPEELSRSADFTRRFASEGQALAKMDHRGVVRVLNAGLDKGRHFIVLEFVSGGDLDQYLRDKGGRLDEAEARFILEQILEGLAYAHAKGIVHRDLKPANILRDADGRFKISDFGLALVMNKDFVQDIVRRSIDAASAAASADEGATILDSASAPRSIDEEETLVEGASPAKPIPTRDASALVGTIDYMSPEVRAGQSADARSDIYAIGILAYLFLTGRKPIGRAKAASKLCKGISADWDDWIDKCLEIDPQDRFSTAADALEALRNIPNGTGAAEAAAVLPQSKAHAAANIEKPSGDKAQAPARGSADEKAAKSANGKGHTGRILLMATLLICTAAIAGLYKGGHLDKLLPNSEETPSKQSATTNKAPEKQKTAPANSATNKEVAKDQTASDGKAQPRSDKAPGKASTSSGASTEKAKPATGTIRVSTLPEGAKVTLDGKHAPSSPALFENLAKGSHLLKIELAGYDTFEKKISLKEGKKLDLGQIALTRQLGDLEISGRPAGQSWRLISGPGDAGLSSGSVPQSLGKLPTGDYLFEFSLKDTQPRRKSVSITKGETSRIESVYAGGPLLITSNISGAEVRGEKGRLIGKTPLKLSVIPPGRHVFSVSADGYPPVELSGTMSDGGSLSLHATLERSLPVAGENALVPLGKGADIALVWINAGSFRMGSDEMEGGREKDETAHSVRLGEGFWMARTELTQAQWRAVTGANPASFRKLGDNAPVESISWNEAVDFCRRLNDIARKAGTLPDGYEFRLPTEAEWEYCCRAGSSAAFSGAMRDMGWTSANSKRGTSPVAQKTANAWGLYDMHGNVAEWCADWYAPYSGKAENNPTGPAQGQYKIARGGSWQQGLINSRSAARNRFLPSDRWNYVGMRLVMAPLTNK